MTKREIKKAYLAATLDLSDAIAELMFEHGLARGEAFRYIGL